MDNEQISQQELCQGGMVLIQSFSEDLTVFILTIGMDMSNFPLISVCSQKIYSMLFPYP